MAPVLRGTVGWVLIFFFHAGVLFAQNCDPNVPVLEVDLSSGPDATFLSPTIVREGNCCGTTAPDRCIAFNITLNEGAQGIIFDICSGAVPPGALFYQINCGPPVAVGSMICLDGTGPHRLTFCKPGNNQNQYCINSVPAPAAGPDTLASEGCSALLTSTGFDPTTVVWTSVSPGPAGALNSLLSCTNCENPVVIAPQEIIEFADFQVCGMPLGGCTPALICDTVRVFFASTLQVTIEPEVPVICDGDDNVSVSAIGSGGYPPYTFTWSTGASGSPILIDAPGFYSVQISDASGCPPAEHIFQVYEYTQPVTVDAGADQVVCSLDGPISLEGIFSGADSAMWSGGNGTFTPDEFDPQAQYQPSPDEVAAGTVSLTLTVLPGGGCPGTTDDVVLSISPFNGQVAVQTEPVSCYGMSDGMITLEVNGSDGPYTIEWDQPGMEGFTLMGLSAMSYSATLFNFLGCPFPLEVTINEPTPLEVNIESLTHPLCNGGENGSAILNISGGTPPYSVSWTNGNGATGSELEAIPSGEYVVEITDANSCVRTLSFSLIDPPGLFLEAEDSLFVCIGESLTLEAIASGGTGDLNYHWSQGLGNAPSHEVLIVSDTIVTVYVSDQNGCITPTEEIAVSVISMDPSQLYLAGDTGICPGEVAFVEGIYQGDYPPYTYVWDPKLPSGPGPYSVSPQETTVYHLTVSDVCGNILSGEVEIEVFDLPELDQLDLVLTSCFPATFTLRDTLNTTGDITHFWNVVGGEILTGNPAYFTPPSPGLWEVNLEVQTAEGCTNSTDAPLLVEVFPTPEAAFLVLPPVTGIDNPNFTFINRSQGSYTSINWSIEGENFSGLDTMNYSFPDTGQYVVALKVVNDFGCADSIAKSVRVNPVYNITIPNAFTPTGSGGGGYYDPSNTSNTIFYPFAEYVEEMRMSIFNRWGELIFESDQFEYGWDGTYRNKPCPQDVYVYRIDFVFSDGVEITRVGDLTLFR